MAMLDRFKKIAAGLTAAHISVADLRADLAEIEDGIEAVKARPMSRADAIAKARREINEAAEVGEVLLKRAASEAALGTGRGVLDFVTDAGDVRHLLAAVAGDQLIELFEAQAAARWGDDPGLTEDEREAELVRLHNEAFQLELAEEALLRQAAAAGLAIDRRPDAHPAAILAPASAMPA